jgi:hypothetical protein
LVSDTGFGSLATDETSLVFQSLRVIQVRGTVIRPAVNISGELHSSTIAPRWQITGRQGCNGRKKPLVPCQLHQKGTPHQRLESFFYFLTVIAA